MSRVSEQQEFEASPGRQQSSGQLRGGWGWALVLGGLTLVGLLLTIADIAIDSPWTGPFAAVIARPSPASSHLPAFSPKPERFGRLRPGFGFSFAGPFGMRGPISPLEALRALLSNGAGLIFMALAALVLFPRRVRAAVERLELRHGPEIALAAGVASLLLALAAITLLRFTLLFLAIVPVVLVVALATALFGIACIAFALGRLLRRRLRLSEAYPLLVALAGALIIFDFAVIPYIGVFALAAIAIAGLGLAVVTRFGSQTGWSFGDLSW
jgi:hypothetical protein